MTPDANRTIVNLRCDQFHRTGIGDGIVAPTAERTQA
jgi:hypothetical protein